MTGRYLRHDMIDWFDQAIVSQSKAIVIGAGAVGNEVIKSLVLLGVGQIHVCDFDLIEIHNLTRSVLFREEDVGQPKAQVACERAKQLDPNVHITFTYGDFWDDLSLSQIKHFDAVYCCVDNFEARIRSNLLCRLAGVDLINVGIDSRACVVEVFPLSAGSNVACYECHLPHSVYQRLSQRYSCGHLKKVSFIEKKIPTTIVTSSIAASFACSEGLRLAIEGGAKEASRIFVDTINGTSSKITMDKNAECACCSRIENKVNTFAAQPMISDEAQGLDGAIQIIASDPILVGYRIGETYTSVFRKASEFDSDFPAQVSDDPGAVDLDIRDSFTAEELIRAAGGIPMPCKFVMANVDNCTLVLEFMKEEI